jgi:hypothetical protein
MNIVENGKKCLGIVFSDTAEDNNNNKDNDYDIFIVDTRLISWFDIFLIQMSLLQLLST